MEVTIARTDLIRGLHLAQGVIERRNPVPILAHVLLDSMESGVTLTATDMDVGVRAHVGAQVRKKGKVTLNARKLYEIARESTADDMLLKSAQVGWVDILCGRSKFRIVSLEPKDFPELPLDSTTEVSVSINLAAAMLREMVQKTLFAVSTDDTRFNLSGVFLCSGDAGRLRMVSTDGHRLAMIDRDVSNVRLEQGIIMPRRGLLEVVRLIEESEAPEITLEVGSSFVRFATQDVCLFMRLVQGEFPDYKQVIPSSTSSIVRANRDELLAALRRISLLASERSRGVKLHLEEGRLEVSASNPDQGEASEDMEISYAGEPISIGFNARYLIEALTAQPDGEVIELGLTDEVGPAVLRGSQDPEYTYVVMPMRL